jgi:hypothetical protein
MLLLLNSGQGAPNEQVHDDLGGRFGDRPKQKKRNLNKINNFGMFAGGETSTHCGAIQFRWGDTVRFALPLIFL